MINSRPWTQIFIDGKFIHLNTPQRRIPLPAGRHTITLKNPKFDIDASLISNATVIVEAGDGSGTLHQGWEALRLNRPLFIMKSVFAMAELKWPKEMLEYGAMVLSDFEELLENLPSTLDAFPDEIAL